MTREAVIASEAKQSRGHTTGRAINLKSPGGLQAELLDSLLSDAQSGSA
jgi:hypothetical protein